MLYPKSMNMPRTAIIAAFAAVSSVLVFSHLWNSPHRIKGGFQANAVWIESLYLRGYQPSTKQPLTDKALAELSQTLRLNSIKYAYMFAGPCEKDGHLPEYAFEPTAKDSAKRLRQLDPTSVVLPWVGGVINKTVFLSDSKWVTNAIGDIARLVDYLDVPGVHVNFEFFTYAIPGEFYPGQTGIESFGEDEYRFFEQLRAAMPHAFISTVVESTVSETRQWKRKNSFSEIARISQVVDQVAVLFYDTSIADKNEFSKALAEQIDDFRRWKEMEPGRRVQYLLGIGTFVNKKELWQFRDLEVESVSNTLETLRRILSRGSLSRPPVDGVAIFAQWTTDEWEWSQIRKGLNNLGWKH
jgi:hypothetical protein